MKKKGWLNPNNQISVLFILLIIAAVESRADISTTRQNFSEISSSSSHVNSKKINFNLGMEYASNLRKDSSPDKDDSLSFMIEPTYRFSEKSDLSVSVDLVQKFNSEKKSSISNVLVVYTPTRIDLTKEIRFLPKVSATLPTNETLRDEQSYEGTISLRPTLEYIPKNILGLVFVNTVYMNRNLHEFKTRNDYSPNIEYSVRNRFEIGYQLSDKWGVEFANDYVRSWTYGGYAREAFYFGQFLSYEFTKNWVANVGHENEGSVRGPNNNGENVEIFNEKSSYVSMGVVHVF